MHVPEWFARDLSLIHPKYFAVFDEHSRTWRIRKWKTHTPRPHTWDVDSKQICIVHYFNLDMRILEDLKRGLYNARHAKKLLQEVDSANARQIEQSDIEQEYVSRYMAKCIYKHFREPMVIGGVDGTNRKHPY